MHEDMTVTYSADPEAFLPDHPTGGWDDTDKENKYSEKALSDCHSVYHIPHMH
jgi:hypothetical protein